MNQTTDHAEMPDDEYVTEVFGVLRRILRATTSSLPAHDGAADDAVQRCIVKLLVGLPKYRAAYQSPAAMAAALARTARADLFRAERVQTSLGARVSDCRTRVAWSDERVNACEAGWVDDPFASVLDRDELRPLVEDMAPEIRMLAWLVWVEGESITEAARIVGWSREHATRMLRATSTRCQTPHGRWSTICR
ncbi:MAG: hypothetical protein ACO225_07375 [Ilumatobacteraceae bacterium]